MTTPTREELEARYGARAMTRIHDDGGPLFGGAAGPVPARTVPAATPPESPDPWSRARNGSDAAARAWSPEQAARVDEAIAACARSGRDFSADDVWRAAPGVPVTKGLAARLITAARRRVIENTGRLTTATRGGKHDHAQRLVVWRGVPA